VYLTCKALGLTTAEWEAMAEADCDELLERELWIGANKEKYDDEATAATSTGSRSTKEKRAIRQKKKGVDPMPMMD